jgi:predicted transposase YdaD
MKTMAQIDAEYKSEMSRARLEGQLEGETRGRQQAGQTLIMRLLTRRFGNISPELQSQVRSLPSDRLEDLGEALLDFGEMNDLLAWLERNG